MFFDLEITDVSFERHLTLARFQQAEIVLEFFKLGVEGNEKKLIHAGGYSCMPNFLMQIITH